MPFSTTLLIALAAGSMMAQPTAAKLQEQIDPLAQSIVDDKAAVGLVVGVLADGKSAVFAYGETKKGSGQSPNGQTIYEIGSVTKVFTGTLLADLVASKAVQLNDPLKKYLPDGVKMLDGRDSITLEHLVTHTSGLPRLPDNFDPSDPKNPYADYSAEKMYAFLGEYRPKRPPGQYAYSNYAMGLLGQILAERDQKDYESAIVARICKPLEMNDTCITLGDSQKERLAPAYDASLAEVKNWDFAAMAGAGALRSTADDLLKFAAANLADDDRPLIKALKRSHQVRHRMNDGMAMALGWHYARDGVTLWHNGMTGGYAAWLSIVPSRRVAVVVLANTATMRVSQLGEQVTRIAFGQTVTPELRKEVAVDAAILKRYVGRFELTPQFALTVRFDDGKLKVQATGQPEFPVFAASDTEFFYKVVDARITFVPDSQTRRVRLLSLSCIRMARMLRGSAKSRPASCNRSTITTHLNFKREAHYARELGW